MKPSTCTQNQVHVANYANVHVVKVLQPTTCTLHQSMYMQPNVIETKYTCTCTLNPSTCTCTCTSNYI